MKTFAYDKRARRRGVTMAVTAILCFLLFSFFLLAGFSDMPWAYPAEGAIASLCLSMLISGIHAAHINRGAMIIREQAITLAQKKRQTELSFAQMKSTAIKGRLSPRLILRGDNFWADPIFTNDTMTRFPLPLLFEYCVRHYQTPWELPDG